MTVNPTRGRVVSSASVSLDGFIAYEDNTPGELFDWYDIGDVEVVNAGDLPPFHLTQESAGYWLPWRESLGALVVGRTLFDITDGWKGTHPLGVPVVVLTHEPPTDWAYPGSEDFHFVTDGIEAAIDRAHALAAGKVVGVAAGTIATQAMAAGLLDQVNMDLVPVVLGSGRRYFTGAEHRSLLADPTSCIPARRVTHLSFPVRD